MTQRGTVREVNGDRIVVGCGRSGGCKNCSSTFCDAEDESVFEVANPDSFNVHTGDSVELYLAPGKTILAGFMVLVLPLMLFAALYLVVSRLSQSDALRAVCGLVGLAAGFCVNFLLKGSKITGSMPVIRGVRRLDADGI